MRLRRLVIERLAGIDGRIVLAEIGDRLQVITGPNGIGKSSLIRALDGLLWPERGAAPELAAAAELEIGDERWRVERDGSRRRWLREGADCDPLPLPGAHLAGCYFLALRDLLDAAEEGGGALAGEIRRQMAGGFDLDQAGEVFGATGPRFGKPERDALDRAERVLHDAAARAEALAREEARLQSLEEDLARADQAQERLASHDDALRVLELRDALARIEAEIEALPCALADARGDERSETEQREQEIADLRQRAREAREQLAEAERDAEQTGLGEPIAAADLDTWSKRADRLGALELELGSARAELAKCRGERIEAARPLGGRADAARALEPAGAAELFGLLRESAALAAEAGDLERQLAALADTVQPPADRARLERVRLAIAALRAWLRAPAPDSHRTVLAARRRALLWLAAALTAAGLVLAWLAGAPGAAVLGAGLGLGAAAAWLRLAPPGDEQREAARRDFPPDLAAPERWTEEAVEAALRGLEGEAAKLEAAGQRAAYAETRRGELDGERAALEERRARLEARRGALAAALGLDRIPPDAELVDTARALDGLRRARAAEAGAQAREHDLAERYHETLAALAAALAAHGERAPTDAASARAAVDSLRARNEGLKRARERARNARKALERAEADSARIEGVVAGIYRRLGLEAGDRDRLARLLERLGEYRELTRKREQLAIEIEVLEERLARAGERGLGERTAEQLRADRAGLQARAGQRGELREEIARIREQVRRAREGHDLEDAAAEREARRARLAEARDRALRDAAGRFLCERVRREHETVQRPRVLERADELFGRFTHHAYRLRLAAREQGSFEAVDATTGAGVAPERLSDGTRAQLLLAVRLAFAEQAEPGEALPLFLDEALDQCDPSRFEAIARSLGRMVADEGRQVFYLTSDPADAGRIERALDAEGCGGAEIIDLAALRRGARGVTRAESLRVAALPEVPSPEGRSAEEYGALLGIEPLDPRRGHGAQHLWYLAWDDLALLHRLLIRRIERVGQWQNLSRAGGGAAGAVVAGSPVGAQLGERARLLEAFCDGWLIGRGRALDRAAIERCAAVTEHFRDAVADIAAELGGDASQLIEVVHGRADERLRGFRGKNARALEAYLADEGYLDPREPLDESDLTARLLAVPAAGRLPEGMAAACAHRWWQLAGGSGGTGCRV